MYQADLQVVEYEKWNKKMFKIYWCFALLTFVGEASIFLFTPWEELMRDNYYLWDFLIKPTFLNILVISVFQGADILIKNKWSSFVKPLILICGTFMACNIAFTHYNIPVIYTIFILPICLSQCYADRKLTTFTAIFNIISYLFFYSIHQAPLLQGWHYT